MPRKPHLKNPMARINRALVDHGFAASDYMLSGDGPSIHLLGEGPHKWNPALEQELARIEFEHGITILVHR